jgi:hypothetical protein
MRALPSFPKHPIILSVYFVFSKLFNYLWSSHTDLGIETLIVGTLPVALIPFLFCSKAKPYTNTQPSTSDELKHVTSSFRKLCSNGVYQLLILIFFFFLTIADEFGHISVNKSGIQYVALLFTIGCNICFFFFFFFFFF